MSKAKAKVETKSLGLFTAVEAAHEYCTTPMFSVETDEHIAQITPYGMAVGVVAAGTVAVVAKIVLTKVVAF